MSDRVRRACELAFLAGAGAYLVVFAWRQTPGLLDRYVLEWDAREVPLPAWRFHGTGLFPEDLTVDLMAVYATPLWKAIYWVGTLFTDPLTISKWLPFAGLAVVVWQGFQLGRRAGGPVLGAAAVIILVHCSIFWNRMAGGHARGFAYPIVIAFLRYAAEGAERRALGVIALSAIGYPSAFMFLVPAWALTIGRDRRRWLRLGAVALVAGALMAASMWRVDARLGRPPSRAQAATLAQMGPGGAQPYFPLPPVLVSIEDSLEVPFRAYGDLWRGPIADWNARHHYLLAWALAAAILLAARRRLTEVPRVFGALALSALGAFALAWLAAYRLYLPDRMLLYAWPPVILLGLLLALARALAPRLGARAPLAAGVALVAFFFAVGGDGLPRAENLGHYGAHDTAAIRFVAGLPRDAVIATHPERAVYVQAFARRNVLFSATTNVPFYFGYAVEMERRIGDFYRAYYARDLDEVRRFAARYHVGYLIADERDFGPEALARSDYYQPWRDLNRRLLDGIAPETLALAHPPAAAVIFRDGTRFIIDLARL